MIGILTWKTEEGRGERAVALRERSLLHMRYLSVELRRTPRTPELVVRRRVARAGKLLKRLGIRRLVLPEGFEWGETLETWGVAPVSTSPLRQALAADWVRWQLNQRGISPAGARVAVCADTMTPEVVRTVTELVLRHRYVLLEVPGGGEALCRQLRREYGVSLLLHPSREQLEGTETAVLFSPRPELRHPEAIPLYDPAASLPPLALPPVLEEQLIEGVNREQLLAALREAGALRPGQLALGSREPSEPEPLPTLDNRK